jgi:O-succinylbenzoate synthase
MPSPALNCPVDAVTLPAIDRIDFLTVRLPFVQPFATSVHSWAVKEALLLRMEAGGVIGWGECVADPDPFYSYETTCTAHHILKQFLLPHVEAGISFAQLEERFRPVRGHGMAKATIENALLDLVARRERMPLHELLGWPTRRIPSGISIGIQETVDDLLNAVEDALCRPYHRVKIKVMRGKDVEWARAVRERFPEIDLMVDANGDYRLEDAERLRELDAFGLTMIEQPLSYSDIIQHAQLQKGLRTPLCLDESIHSLDDALSALDMDACRIINIKQGRVGGMLESLRIAQACKARGIGVWSGGMDETGIGRALNIHLQAADGFSLPGDTSETSRYFHEDIVAPGVVLAEDGFIEMPAGPGTGVNVLQDRLERYTVSTERYL